MKKVAYDEHHKNLDSIINIKDVENVLDAGSGRTSLNYLLSRFFNADIDAIIYPGDNRKKDSIKENVKGKYNLIEVDICTQSINKQYDFVLAHLLLGEAIKFGNTVETVLKSLLKIKSHYFVIYDFKEDNTIDYKKAERIIEDCNFEIIKYKVFEKEEPQKFANFVGENYVAYLLRKKD